MDRVRLLENPMPVDRVAARVVHGKAEHWTPAICMSQPYFDTQPETRKVTAKNLLNPNFVDLTGRKIGLMRVCGLASDAAQNGKGTRWVVRCQCATYVIVSGAAIKRASDPNAACPRCAAKRKIRGILD